MIKFVAAAIWLCAVTIGARGNAIATPVDSWSRVVCSAATSSGISPLRSNGTSRMFRTFAAGLKPGVRTGVKRIGGQDRCARHGDMPPGAPSANPAG